MKLLILSFPFIHPFQRSMAAAAPTSSKKAKGKSNNFEEKPPERIVEMRPIPGEQLTGLNIFTKKPAPTIQPTEAYPDWVFSDVEKIYGPKPSSVSILKSFNNELSKATEEQLYDLKRALKRENTQEIRRMNLLKSK